MTIVGVAPMREAMRLIAGGLAIGLATVLVAGRPGGSRATTTIDLTTLMPVRPSVAAASGLESAQRLR